MTKQELLQKMTNLVNKTVKHYKEDFTVYDVKHLDEIEAEGKNAAFMWIIRECGTHIIGLENGELTAGAADYLEAVRYYHKQRKEYKITFSKGMWTIKKLKTA